jgi:hypothetical protein
MAKKRAASLSVAANVPPPYRNAPSHDRHVTQRSWSWKPGMRES